MIGRKRLLVLLLGAPRVAEIAVGLGVVRRACDRALVMRRGFFEFAALVMDDADIVESLRHVGIEFDRSPSRGKRGVKLAGLPVHLPEIAVIEGDCFFRRGGAGHELDRC